MVAANWPGREELVSGLDLAVQGSGPDEVTGAVESTLVDLIGRRALHLPDEACRCVADGYGRHLVYRSEDRDYAVIAMVWGPGQGTALHDHSGIWCVEGVVEGEIEVVQYEMLEEDGDRCRFRPQGKVKSGVGGAGSLIPPFEYHTIHNAREEGRSITLHVYARELDRCCVFEEAGDGWYERRERQLAYS